MPRRQGVQRKKHRVTGGYDTRYLVSDLPTGACADEEALTGSSLSSGQDYHVEPFTVSTPSIARTSRTGDLYD